MIWLLYPAHTIWLTETDALAAQLYGGWSNAIVVLIA